MNSSLQCLSNTFELTSYFISDYYLNHINKNNPLGKNFNKNKGTKGKISKEYGNLLKSMWSGTKSSVAPSELKYLIGYYNSQFNGYR
jgi:ubiquitin C-terminal hydrolase